MFGDHMTRFFSSTVLFLSILIAQSVDVNNMRFVGHVPYSSGSDIWGYIDSTGHEFALMGLYDGTTIVDVSTNPSFPTEVGFIPGVGSIWRDIKVHEHYAYVTNETGNGLDVIDLADPYNPVLVNRFDSTFTTAHNLYITDGYAYIVGPGGGPTWAGIRILDLSDPVNPVEVGTWNVDYIHDIYVRNDTAYACGIYTGTLYIVDVSDKTNPVTMVAHQYSTYGSHQVWLMDDSRYIVTADEYGGGHIIVWDAQDFNNINFVSSYEVGNGKSVHNVFYKDGYLYMSYYVYGTRVVDLTDPTNPVEVGYFDEYPGDGGLYAGNWGTFPFTNSGLIFSSDMSGYGLFILSYPFLGSVEFTPLTDTENLTDPIPLTVTVVESPNVAIDYATLMAVSGLEGVYSDTTYLLPTGNPDEYSGNLPPPLSMGDVWYYVSFETVNGDLVTEPYGAPQAHYSFHAGTDFIPPVIHSLSDLADDFYPEGERMVYVEANDNIGISRVEVLWKVNESAPDTIVCSPFGLSETMFVGDLVWSGLNPGDVIYYRARVTDASSNQNVSESGWKSFSILEDFLIGNFEDEASLTNWTLGDWGRQYINSQYGYGLNDSPGGQYEPNAYNPCTLAEPLDLTYFSHAYLTFTSLTMLEDDKDFGYIQISTDSVTWETYAVVTGISNIQDIVVNLDPYLNESQVYFRLLMTSDSTNQSLGWFVDDIHLILNQEPPVTGLAGVTPAIPQQVTLYPNYPNPFNPSTTLSFFLPQDEKISLTLYNILGQRVATLLTGIFPSGQHTVRWDGKGDSGEMLPSGIYLVHLAAGSRLLTQKIALVR